MTLRFFVFSLVSILACARGAKILGIFPNFGYSQFVLGGKLMRELAARGHEVTVIGPFPSKVPIKNYRDVSTAELVQPLGETDLFASSGDGVFANIISVVELGLVLTELTFETPAVRQLLASDETFDLVVCELFFNEAQMGFARRFEAPLVLFSSFGPYEATHDLTGNPQPYSYVPSLFASFADRMSFTQRLVNSFVIVFFRLYRHLYALPKHNELLRKYLPESPELPELMYETADLVLFNSHFSTQFPVPTVPGMIEIGGFHVEPEPLPDDLREFLDAAGDEGVVYFSMGSILKGKNFPADKRDGVLRAFAKLKQKVLWKWEDEELPGKPPNVKIAKWLPQQDVLAHPNVKVFVSHCGLMSTIEAAHHGVPVIGIPIFGDQKMNMALTEAFGSGIALSFRDLTEETLTSALDEILDDPKYRERAKFRAELLRDRPTKPMDEAAFWIDHVVRHNGTRHLRVAGSDLNWFQYHLLDVAAVVLGCLAAIAWATSKLASGNSVGRGKKTN